MSDEGNPRDVVAWVREGWARECPDLPTGSVAIITRVWRIAKTLSDARQRLLADLGMDAATLDLLSVLRRSGPPYALPAGVIARRSLVTPGAVSQRIARAEASGLVERTRSRTDGRGVLVRLTEAGRGEGERVAAAVLRTEDALLADLPRPEFEAIAAYLERLDAHLADRLPVGHPLV